jgi:hypothetical protein
MATELEMDCPTKYENTTRCKLPERPNKYPSVDVPYTVPSPPTAIDDVTALPVL